MHNFNLPNGLTGTRIVLSPLIWPVLAYEVHTWLWVVLVTAGIILVLSTDFFDGYFADKLDQHTALGECLDPVGDKLIVVLTIAILFKYHDLAVFTVAAGLSVLYRETIISGVRDFLGQNGESMPSIWSAKVKTAVQMVGIGFMVVGNAFDALLPQLSGYYLSVHMMGELIFSVGAVLGLYSGYKYSGSFMVALARKESLG